MECVSCVVCMLPEQPFASKHFEYISICSSIFLSLFTWPTIFQVFVEILCYYYISGSLSCTIDRIQQNNTKLIRLSCSERNEKEVNLDRGVKNTQYIIYPYSVDVNIPIECDNWKLCMENSMQIQWEHLFLFWTKLHSAGTFTFTIWYVDVSILDLFGWSFIVYPICSASII